MALSMALAQRTQKPVLHARHWVAITGKPLAATARERRESLFREARDHPAVKAVLERFPDAEIVDVRDEAPADPVLGEADHVPGHRETAPRQMTGGHPIDHQVGITIPVDIRPKGIGYHAQLLHLR